jgi:AraC-like DNA-binding protein
MTMSVEPSAGMESWELSALRHERLAEGAALPLVAGPVWALVLGGVVVLETSGGTDPLRTGDAVLIDARTAYRLVGAEDAEVAVADLRVVVPPSPVPSPLVVRDFARRHHGVHELVRTCPLRDECRPTAFAASYGGLIGASMVGAWQEDHASLGDPRTAPADAAVTTVVAALAADSGADWTVGRMARLVHLSRSALGERFRRELGRTPVQVLREIRMQQARRLLADEVRSVGEIGRGVGYGSSAAFSRAFSAHHGMSPQEWRADRSVTEGRATAVTAGA